MWRRHICEHSSGLCCVGGLDHLVHILACTCGDCRPCAQDRPWTVQTVAVSSCGCYCNFQLILGIARQCRFTSASKHLVCRSIGALVWVCKPTIQFLGCLCLFLLETTGLPLRTFALLYVKLHVVNKWWNWSACGPSASGPSCLHSNLVVFLCCLWGVLIPSCPLLGVHFATFHALMWPLLLHTCPPSEYQSLLIPTCPAELCTSRIRPPCGVFFPWHSKFAHAGVAFTSTW